MPYTDPVKTFASGELLTAADLNTYLRDNLAFLVRPPACSVFNSLSQTIASSTLVILAADSEDFDNDSMHSGVTNTSRITANTAGRYMLTATVFFDIDASGTRFIEFLINGTTRFEGIQTVSAGSVNATVLQAVHPVTLAAGDYVEVRARHTTTGNLAVTLRQFSATFMGMA